VTNNEIISTGIAVAAIIVSWLSRQDSKKSAEAAQKSADAAHRANDLLARQLELTAEEQKRQIQRQAAENRPLLTWRGAGPANEGQYFEFTNQGALMSNAKVIVDNGLEGSIMPKEVIATGQPGRLEIKTSKIQQLPKVVNCSIEFSDKHNERRKIDLRLLSNAVGKFFNFPPELA
jgi:hypothetical protein